MTNTTTAGEIRQRASDVAASFPHKSEAFREGVNRGFRALGAMNPDPAFTPSDFNDYVHGHSVGAAARQRWEQDQ